MAAGPVGAADRRLDRRPRPSRLTFERFASRVPLEQIKIERAAEAPGRKGLRMGEAKRRRQAGVADHARPNRKQRRFMRRRQFETSGPQ